MMHGFPRWAVQLIALLETSLPINNFFMCDDFRWVVAGVARNTYTFNLAGRLLSDSGIKNSGEGDYNRGISIFVHEQDYIKAVELLSKLVLQGVEIR